MTDAASQSSFDDTQSSTTNALCEIISQQEAELIFLKQELAYLRGVIESECSPEMLDEKQLVSSKSDGANNTTSKLEVDTRRGAKRSGKKPTATSRNGGKAKASTRATRSATSIPSDGGQIEPSPDTMTSSKTSQTGSGDELEKEVRSAWQGHAQKVLALHYTYRGRGRCLIGNLIPKNQQEIAALIGVWLKEHPTHSANTATTQCLTIRPIF